MFWLAILQGITEFIPVSSSGHLVLAKHFMVFDTGDGALIEIVLHGGSLVAILFYYRLRLAALIGGACRGEREAWRETGLILLGIVPVMAVYLVLGSTIEGLFQQPRLAAVALLATGGIVVSIQWARRADAVIDPGRASGIGLCQVLALLPGISRSGTTIAAARHLGLSGERAAAFSFLMLVPLLGGASLIGLWRLYRGDCTGDASTGVLWMGFVVSALTSLASMHVLMRALQRNRFWCFGLYALAVGAASLVALALTGQ